ncbi:MAG: hypothetical protein AAF639_04915 [Chloroflexota bacterium]
MSTLIQELFNEIKNEVVRLLDEKNTMGAFKKLNASIKQYSSSGDLYAFKVIILQDMGDDPAIIQDTTQALDLGLKYRDDLEKDLYLYRAKAYNTLGEYQNAISDTSKVISLDPKSSLGYGLRAEAYCMMDPPQLQLALEDSDKAIELDPNEPFARRLMVTGTDLGTRRLDSIF